MRQLFVSELLSVFLIAAFCSPAMASHVDDASAQQTPEAATWTVTGPEAALKVVKGLDLASVEPTAQAKGTAVAKALREAGLLSAVVTVRDNVIEVALAKPTFTGPYAKYFRRGKYLTKRQLEAGAVRASNRAKSDGKSVSIDVGQAKDGQIAIATSEVSVADWQRWNASVGVNNFGSRYAGSDMGTAYGRVSLNHGNEAYASLAHGFSNSNPDSYGGSYEGASVGFAHHGPKGTTRVEVSNAIYTAGGQVRIFDLGGRVTTLSVGHWVPLSQSLTAFGQVLFVQNRQSIGAVDWRDKQQYGIAKIGIEKRTANTSTTVTVEKGLGGEREFNAVPLLGKFDPNFTAVTIDVSGKKALGDDGWVLKGRAGARIASSDTPSNEQFVAGGPARGRAWLTGTAAAQRGAYAEAVIEAPTRNGFTPYAGVDVARLDPKSGPSQTLSSAFVGTRYTRGAFSIDAGYAHGFGSNDMAGEVKDSRLFLSASFSW